MAVKYEPFIEVWVPSYSRQEDNVTGIKVKAKVERSPGGEVMIVPVNSTPTKPFLVMFNLDDVKEALEHA